MTRRLEFLASGTSRGYGPALLGAASAFFGLGLPAGSADASGFDFDQTLFGSRQTRMAIVAGGPKRRPFTDGTKRKRFPFWMKSLCAPLTQKAIYGLGCLKNYPPIPKIIGLKYGTSQISQTTTLNLWKLLIHRSSSLSKTIVAQTAWTNMRIMANNPVSPCTSNVIPPAISNIIPVPEASQMSPNQKKTRCHAFNVAASRSLQTPME